jgi:hypothetical protein
MNKNPSKMGKTEQKNLNKELWKKVLFGIHEQKSVNTEQKRKSNKIINLFQLKFFRPIFNRLHIFPLIK